MIFKGLSVQFEFLFAQQDVFTDRLEDNPISIKRTRSNIPYAFWQVIKNLLSLESQRIP